MLPTARHNAAADVAAMCCAEHRQWLPVAPYTLPIVTVDVPAVTDNLLSLCRGLALRAPAAIASVHAVPPVL